MIKSNLEERRMRQQECVDVSTDAGGVPWMVEEVCIP